MSGLDRTEGIHLTDEQRLDWLRLIRSENVGWRGPRKRYCLS
jgi:gluconate kinase